MSRLYTLLCCLFSLLILLNPSKLSAQVTMWPGDINNNGICNSLDVLRWGYGFGATGSARFDNGSEWKALNVTGSWSQNFPEETNFLFGDCNGNGRIDVNDVRNTITTHFGKTHGNVQPDFTPIGAQGVAPELKLTASKDNFGAGEKVDLLVSLGSSVRPAFDFYGIAFRIKYNRDMVKPGAVTFTPEDNGWYDPTGTVSYTFFNNNSSTGVIEVAVVRTNQIGQNGFGALGTLSLTLRGNTELVLPGALNLQADQVQMINSEMEIIPIYYDPDLVVVVSGGNPAVNCPDVIEPVCGSDGITYLNSCYAEAAGITNYTLGVCFSDCINPNLIQANVVCPTQVEPVCGCNNITYTNACEADAAGITSYQAGPCQPDSDERPCYDPILVAQSSGTTVDPTSGIVTINCPTVNDPVCACNGITYRNACEAEASGIAFYTPGTCNTTCVDPTQMDLNANCPTVYEPVCGCNNITYSNPCAADAAGVINYTNGACGTVSPWCAEAIPIQCGNFLAQETTEGAGNQITQYPGCSQQSFLGPDRVYVFEKTTAGDLQIGLEILTPGVDLDLFLLSGQCNPVSCLRSSTTNNQNTNNEGIILADAPLGTYYIVVDAQFADAQAKFRLEVNCGYLYCGDAIELECGEPFKFNNSFGEDDVSLYACESNVLNVENNGPEVTHYFTTTVAGNVDIKLSGLSANLELFLLGDCDRGECLRYSENPGTSDEVLSVFLEAGTYFVVVDGHNGATSDYTLQVDCANTCDLAITNISSTPSNCGSNSGTIRVTSSGGTPAYIVYFDGPVSGSFSTSSNAFTINFLPPGTYQIRKIDSKGCEAVENVTVYSSGDLEADVSPTDAVCNEDGFIWVSIKNGKAPYKVYLSGPESTNISLSQTTFKLSNLEQGTYTLYIVDANGCAVTKKATVQKAESNFDADLTPFPATCSELGSVHVATRNGVAPFRITLNGPVSGSAQANGNNFNIKNLPGGTYELTLEDANGCTFKDAFTIGDVSLDFDLTVSNGICGQTGSIKVDVAIGEAPYTIKWTGPKQGSVDISSDSYTIADLLNGSYQIEIIDANQCSAFEVVSVNNESNQLATDAVAIDGTCGENGAILVDINNGASPYSISWTGVANGSLNTTKTSLDIPNLPEGLYKVVITDKNNCSAEHTVYVDTESALTFTASGFDGSCGQDGSIRVTITSGQANYIINWEGPITGSATVTEEVYDLTSLPSGSYNIAVTDANGCVDNAEVKIKNAEGFLSLTPVIQPATCDSTGAMALTVAGGKAPYVVEWVGPISGQLVTDAAGKLTIPDLPAGSYELYAVDQNGCTGAQAAVIETEGSDIKIALSNIDPICTKTGGIVVSIVNGNPNFNVTWDGPVSGTGTTSTSNFSIIDLPAGTYKVAVTDKFGCQAINQVTLVSSGDLDVTAKAAGAACGQGNIAVQLDKGTASFEISWTGPVSGTATTNNKNYLINDLPDGDYTISVVDINGCTDEAKVNLYSGGQPEILATPKVGFCGEAGGIGVSVSGGAPNFSLTWEGPKNGIATVSGNYFDITDLPNGKYLVTLTDANGCKDEAEVNIVNEVTNLEATTSILANSCGQTNIISVDITGGQAKYIVSWSGPQNGADTISTLNYQIKDLITGTYQISVTDAQGCQVIQTRSIQPAPIDIMKLTAFSGVCEQLGYLQVEIPGGKSPYTISWSGPVNGTTSTSGKSIKITFLPRGTYTVKITDANGCAETEVIDITYEDSSLDFTAEVEENECGQKTTALITINAGQAPYTIKWTGPESGSKSIGSSIYRIPDLQVGEYEIEITDGRGCIAIKDLKVTDPPLKLTSIEAVPGNCGALGQIVIDIKGGKPNYVISWTGPKSGTATITGNSYSINDLPDGDYNVTMSDANGCVETAKITIQNSETLEATMSGVNGNCTSAPSININISSGNPGFVIAWTGPTTGTATITNLSYKIENLVAGQYDVQITDAKGCQQSQTLNLQGIASNLKVEATGTNGSCGENGFITLKISGGTPNYTINWSGPRSGTTTIDETNFTIPQLPSGKYTVEIVDKNGCAESSSVTIVNQANLAVTIKGTNGICGGLGNIAFDFTSNPPFKITWAGASAGTAAVNNKFYNLADLKSGPYNISVTDANDCVYTQTITINNSANDLDFTTSTTPGSCDKPGSIGLNIVGGTANFTIKWSSPNAQGNTTVSTRTYTIPQLPGGIYQITISDKNGCETTKQLELKNIDNTVKLTASVENPSCAGKGSITVGVDGSFPDFTIKWTGPSSGSKVTGKGNYTIENLSEGTYNIEVSDVNGCKQTTILTLIDKAGQPNAFFTHTSKNLTVDLLHTADTGTYLWDFGDGTTSTSPNPSYQFCEPGTYLVCLTLTNDCGTATYCSNVTVSIPADVVILDIGEKVASVASKVQVPVTMSNGSILASLAGSLEMLDPTVAVVKGLVPGLIMPQYNNLNRTFTYFHNGGQGIPVPNGTILFYIELQIIGAPGKTSAIRFSDTPLSVEVGGLNASGQAVKLAHVSLKGRVTVGISASISGNVRTYQGDPIPNAEVQLTGTDIASSEFTDAAGKFTIPDLSLNQEYTVTPKKNDLPFNGLSTYSLFIGQRFILGQEPSQIASPYQVIAGDANCNGAFSTLDLFIVQQLIIGATETFTYCPSWVFVSSDNPTPTEFDAYNVFPYKDFHKFKIQNDTTVSFIGVKVGDILGSANPDPFAGEEIEIEERNPTYLNLNTPNQQVRAGEEVILECSSKDFIDIVSYQFSLDFDTQFLEFVEFQGGSTNELAPVMAGDRWAERGQVLLSWFSQQGRGIDANVEDQLFRVRFKALQDIEDLSELISVEDLPLRAEAHSGMGDRYRIQLDWLDSFSTDPQVQQLPFKLYQNIPNPARERTEIRFDLPEASLGELRVHDHLGRLIQRQTGSFVAGHNRLSLPIADLQGGVYYYTLKAGSHTATRSMVVLK